jgi:hypothetical protein
MPIAGAGSQFKIVAALSNCGPAPITCGEGANVSFAFAYSGNSLRGLGGVASGARPPDEPGGNGGDDNGGNGVIVDPGGDEPPEHVPEPSALQGLLLGTGLLGLAEMARRKRQLGT